MRKDIVVPLITLVLLCVLGTSASAQYINLLDNGTEQVEDESTSNTKLAVPAGAEAGTGTSDGSSGASPQLGFQYWEPEEFFVSVIFSYAVETEIDSDFGAYLLNPTKRGFGFSTAGNRIFGDAFSWGLWGVGGRLSVCFPTWKASILDAESEQMIEVEENGLLIAFNIGIQFMTKAIKTGDDQNSYKIGVELAPGVRILGGGLSDAKETFLRSESVLGTKKTSYVGTELTFFLQLNSIQPFLRLSYYGASTLDGLNDLEGFVGVTVLSSLFQSGN